MPEIKQYLISVIAAAMLCSIVQTMFRSNPMLHSIIKFVSGTLFVVALLSPALSIQWDDYDIFWNVTKSYGFAAAQKGNLALNDTLSQIIKDETTQYIVNKGAETGLDIDVWIEMDPADPTQLNKIRLSGSVAPLTRSKFVGDLANELDIPKESIIWRSGP